MEAVHRTKRLEDRNAIAVVDRGIQTLKKDLATRVARKGGQAEGPPRQRRQVPAQTNRRIKAVEDAGAFRAPTNAARSFNPQYGDVQQLTVRSTEEAGAAGAPGQRQRDGPTDEAGQAGSCQAAGRLPGASKAQDPRLITATLDQTGNFA